MSPFKPMKRKDYERWIKTYGWRIEKTGNDWKVVDKKGHPVILFLKITHPGGDVIPAHVNKTQKLIDEIGDQP